MPRRGVSLSKGARAGIVLISFAAAIGLILFGIFGYLRSSPVVVTATQSTSQPNTVNLVMQVDGAVGVGAHPNWVGYWVQDANGVWHQTTLVKVPVNTNVHVTVYEYDSGGALRNPEWAKVSGVLGGQVNLNGTEDAIVNPNSPGNGIAHTFVIPGLNVTVPLYGVNGSVKNFCQTGPCNLSEAHTTTSFAFFSGSSVHSYHWQCFVPCGLGYLEGNGGPMQSLGNMAGFFEVVK